jgi:hypothetical protein
VNQPIKPDLTTRLLAAIEDADDVKEDDPSGHCDDLEGRHYMADEVHRRCAADRKIVELHGSGAHECSVLDHTDNIDACHYVLEGDNCSTLLLLAGGYGITEEDDRWMT